MEGMVRESHAALHNRASNVCRTIDINRSGISFGWVGGWVGGLVGDCFGPLVSNILHYFTTCYNILQHLTTFYFVSTVPLDPDASDPSNLWRAHGGHHSGHDLEIGDPPLPPV